MTICIKYYKATSFYNEPKFAKLIELMKQTEAEIKELRSKSMFSYISSDEIYSYRHKVLGTSVGGLVIQGGAENMYRLENQVSLPIFFIQAMPISLEKIFNFLKWNNHRESEYITLRTTEEFKCFYDLILSSDLPEELYFFNKQNALEDLKFILDNFVEDKDYIEIHHLRS